MCSVASAVSHSVETPWPVARQAPLSWGFSAKIPEWAAMPSLDQDWTHISCVSCIAGGFFRRILYHYALGEMVQIPGNSNFSWLQALLHLGSGDVTDIMHSLYLYLFFFSASFSVSEDMRHIPIAKWIDIITTRLHLFLISQCPSSKSHGKHPELSLKAHIPTPEPVTGPQCTGHGGGLNLGVFPILWAVELDSIFNSPLGPQAVSVERWWPGGGCYRRYEGQP